MFPQLTGFNSRSSVGYVCIIKHHKEEAILSFPQYITVITLMEVFTKSHARAGLSLSGVTERSRHFSTAILSSVFHSAAPVFEAKLLTQHPMDLARYGTGVCPGVCWAGSKLPSLQLSVARTLLRYGPHTARVWPRSDPCQIRARPV